MEIVIATRNAHKLEEIRAVLGLRNARSALDFPELPEVEEDGETLEANAVKKAVETARATGCWALADDSGLEVDALGGAPGVYSARWAGAGCSYADNNAKLLRELEGATNRRARFRTVIALSDPAGVQVRVVEGVCEGRIIDAPRGKHGFGYDPLFVPEGYEQTFAELPPEVKNRISHRARALDRAAREWKELFEANA